MKILVLMILLVAQHLITKTASVPSTTTSNTTPAKVGMNRSPNDITQPPVTVIINNNTANGDSPAATTDSTPSHVSQAEQLPARSPDTTASNDDNSDSSDNSDTDDTINGNTTVHDNNIEQNHEPSLRRSSRMKVSTHDAKTFMYNFSLTTDDNNIEQNHEPSLRRSSRMKVSTHDAKTFMYNFSLTIDDVDKCVNNMQSQEERCNNLAMYAAAALEQDGVVLDAEPKTYKEAMASTEREHWMKARAAELTAHEKNGTWTYVKRPNNQRVLKSMYVCSSANWMHMVTSRATKYV
jgi:hypothetical protein